MIAETGAASMDTLAIAIDGRSFDAAPGSTILDVARKAGVYIPSLCAHPDVPVIEHAIGATVVYRGDERLTADDPHAQWDGCGLCAVEVNGAIVRSCTTAATAGMSVITGSPAVIAYRRDRLSELLRDHPHACLTCAQAQGCPRTQCSSNVPENERCCELLGNCELQRVANYIGIPADVPRYRPRGLPKLTNEPLFDFNSELCIGCLRCVRACNDLRDVGTLGFVMQSGRPVVGTLEAGGRANSHCRFCGACVEVCPTGALTDKIRVVGDEREKILVPCRNSCPAGIDIPRLLRYIARDEPEKAAAVIREKVPLAFSVSYACFHPCEEKCRRGEVNEPVSVCRLKRYAMDADDGSWHLRQAAPAPSGKQVAVIGSGPAGLTAAYYCARKGHTVTIYEKHSLPGGMLLTGVPEYRLPRQALDRDIETIRNAGAEIRCDAPIDAAGLSKLSGEYDAVFIAGGANEAKRIVIPGIDLDGVYWGVEFLHDRALGRLTADLFKGLRVAVVGGGNVAVDSARVARRIGAKEVCMISLESAKELPAWAWEVEEARDEEILLAPSWGPSEIVGESGKVVALIAKRCMRVFDENRRFSPQYDESRTQRFDAAAVIIAIGQEPSSATFADCGRTASGTIIVDPETLATTMPRVFAGGDIASGPKSIIEAVAMGRTAASGIDKLLGGDGVIEETLVDRDPPQQRIGKVEGFAGLERNQPAMADAGRRAASFESIEQTYDPPAAVAEASRCLCCDLRLEITEVERAPRAEESLYALTEEKIAAVTDAEGVFQLFDADKKVLLIKGVMSLRKGLQEALAENNGAVFFIYEKEPMYTKRESELIQQYLQEHGELPGGGAGELDDLF
ncbi:MAG: FAD-dependent oxidoreductase [Chitinispirillaceae bacterium]|nr:FAD-dependent oxidoreductase [Chitinispirillaceae bacterium]